MAAAHDYEPANPRNVIARIERTVVASRKEPSLPASSAMGQVDPKRESADTRQMTALSRLRLCPASGRPAVRGWRAPSHHRRSSPANRFLKVACGSSATRPRRELRRCLIPRLANGGQSVVGPICLVRRRFWQLQKPAPGRHHRAHAVASPISEMKRPLRKTLTIQRSGVARASSWKKAPSAVKLQARLKKPRSAAYCGD